MKRSQSKKQRLAQYLGEHNPGSVSEELWAELLALLAPISESYLRDLLHGAGLAIAQPFGGVRESSFEELEASLLELNEVYAAAVSSGDRTRAMACRRVAIQGKDRARRIASNERADPKKREQKAEMAEWILVWLENPGIFESWAALRRKSMACPRESG